MQALCLPETFIVLKRQTQKRCIFLWKDIPLTNCFRLLGAFSGGGFTSSAQPEISADPTTVAGLKIPEMGKFGIQTSDFGFGQLELETDDRQIKIQEG